MPSLQHLPSLALELISTHLTGNALLCLEATLPRTVTQRCWHALCDSHLYRQTGSRSRGIRPWKVVYLHHACVNCANQSEFTLNSNCGSGRQVNTTFALCARCMGRGDQLLGLKQRLRSEQHQYQTMVHRVMAARRTIQECSGKKPTSRQAPQYG